MEIKNKDLKRRIIEISYKYKLSHLGSCLTAVDIIKEIYQTKKSNEKFILSSGHAALALYCVIEKHEEVDAEKIFEHHGVHPDRCSQCRIHCSTGSLGHGLPIAVGMALADRNKNVYCLISDGECSEGSIFEALSIISDNLFKLSLRKEYVTEKDINLKIYLNYNHWAAYRSLAIPYVISTFDKLIKIYSTNVEQLPFLKGQDAHYHIMNEEEYNQAMEILK